ncbi:MAG: hypothetical protein K8S23_08310 [Candidatus Cloacimonetes bacterium]|nr:hypothetical protein [Candidatus Cloacimonadota bacterium]
MEDDADNTALQAQIERRARRTWQCQSLRAFGFPVVRKKEKENRQIIKLKN